MYSEVSDDILNFILGGKAEFSIIQDATSTSKKVIMRYEVSKSIDNSKIYFVSTECNTSRIVKYHGYLLRTRDGIKFKRGNAKISDENFNIRSIKGLMWVIKVLELRGCIPGSVHVIHHGRCSRCGRKLKDEESLRYGLGPECRKKVGF